MEPIITKLCCGCKEVKPITEFYKNASRYDGYQSSCKPCQITHGREWHRANTDKSAASWARNYTRNKKTILAQHKLPEVRKRINKLSNVNYHKNRDHYIQVLRKRNADPVFKAKRHEYYKRNKAKYAIYKAQRRALEVNAEGSFTVEEWLLLCAFHDNKCLACGQLKSLSVDHVIPLSKGGSNYISNIQPLCQHCNISKHTKVIDYRPLKSSVIQSIQTPNASK